MIKLKPCPFCGGEAVGAVRTDNKPALYIVCRKCAVSKGMGIYSEVPYSLEEFTEKIDEVVMRWNERTPT